MNKSEKDKLWAEAKSRCRLSAEALNMAKEMGLNPKSLIKNIPSPSQRWKDPVEEWIRSMYEDRKEKSLLKAKKKAISAQLSENKDLG